MKHELEIEYKTLISKDIYEKIINDYKIKNSFIQTNYYFDNEDNYIINNKKALRIREVNNAYTLTYKELINETIHEYHHDIDYKEFSNFIEEGINNIDKYINKLNGTYNYLTNLKTTRSTIIIDDIELFLDKNEYNNITDYEIEIESKDHTTGLEFFNILLNKYNIENSGFISKYSRAINTIEK